MRFFSHTTKKASFQRKKISPRILSSCSLAQLHLAAGHWITQQAIELQETILNVIRLSFLMIQDGNGAAQGMLRQGGCLLNALQGHLQGERHQDDPAAGRPELSGFRCFQLSPSQGRRERNQIPQDKGHEEHFSQNINSLLQSSKTPPNKKHKVLREKRTPPTILSQPPSLSVSQTVLPS